MFDYISFGFQYFHILDPEFEMLLYFYNEMKIIFHVKIFHFLTRLDEFIDSARITNM